MPLRRDDSDEIGKSRSLIESLWNYVHDSGLCLNPDHYDAKERKIKHVAAPEFDTDAVNKSYVERTLRGTRNEIKESFRITRRAVQEVRNDMEKMRRNVEEIKYLNRSVTAQIKNVVTNEILENSFKDRLEGRDIIVRALRDTQKDILNDVEKVRNNVEEVSKSVSALSTKVSNEIQRGVTDLHQQLRNIATDMEKKVSDAVTHLTRDVTARMKNVVTNEILEKSFKTTGRDMIVRALRDTQKDISNDVEKVRNNVEEVSNSVNALLMKVSNEIHRGVTDLRQQMLNMVTKETLEESFKTIGKDTFTQALQNIFDDIKMLHHGVSNLRKQYRRMCVTRTRFDI
ncbi:hypothetical protein ALC57_05333 [Trachymyrmex cornetzi]|uniref:Uncharacterized protein n=1 Tax=Trachymyrmex cornetzi TaxID=471704 RepID=A0A151JB09_9HYME|nr:hypothetical protein ALC57_05333 [Trachymyrmex cornetzi]